MYLSAQVESSRCRWANISSLRATNPVLRTPAVTLPQNLLSAGQFRFIHPPKSIHVYRDVNIFLYILDNCDILFKYTNNVIRFNIASNFLARSTSCTWCGRRVRSDALETHYWKRCVLLARCPHCRVALEARVLHTHLLGNLSFMFLQYTAHYWHSIPTSHY